MDVLAQILAFLDNAIVKTGLVIIGTFLLRRWPRFVNEAAPLVTGVFSIILTILHGLAPEATPIGFNLGPTNMVLAGIFSSGGFLSSLFQDAILPWLFGYGAARAGDHTVVLAKGKTRTEVTQEKKEEPPIVIKPFQVLLPEKK